MFDLNKSGAALALDEPETLYDSVASDLCTKLKTMQSTRVLLIEDDRTTRRLVSSAIGSYCNLIEATTAGSGIMKFKNFEPDVVFLDLELPDDNGHNILKWMTRNDPGSYIVLFSGNCDRYNIDKAVRNGAKGFVPKPFDVHKMMHYIYQCPKLH